MAFRFINSLPALQILSIFLYLSIVASDVKGEDEIFENGKNNDTLMGYISSWKPKSNYEAQYNDDFLSNIENDLIETQNNSVEDYTITRKGENSYILSFGNKSRNLLPSKRTRFVSKVSEVTEVTGIQVLGEQRNNDPIYWTEFTFKGSCEMPRHSKKDLQHVSKEIMFEIVSKLILLMDHVVIFNSYSCHNSMRINVSISKRTYDKNEQLFNDIINREEFSFKLFGRKFTFTEFTSLKFTMLEPKAGISRRGKKFYYLSFGASFVVLLIIAVFGVLYFCYDYYSIKRDFNHFFTHQVCYAFDDDLELSAKMHDIKSTQSNACKKSIDEGSLLTLDYEMCSADILSIERPKLSQSVQGVYNLQDGICNMEKQDLYNDSNSNRDVPSCELEKAMECLHTTCDQCSIQQDYSDENVQMDSHVPCQEVFYDEQLCCKKSQDSIGVTHVECVGENLFKLETDL